MPKTSATGSAPARVRHTGFTLIELMVVLTIVVLTVGAIPYAFNRALPSRRVAMAADALVSDVRWLQLQAAASGRPTRIVVLDGRYRIDAGEAATQPEVRLASSTMVTLHASEDDRVIRELIVHPDGSSSAGWFELSDSGRSERVDVAMLDGRARRARNLR